MQINYKLNSKPYDTYTNSLSEKPDDKELVISLECYFTLLTTYMYHSGDSLQNLFIETINCFQDPATKKHPLMDNMTSSDQARVHKSPISIVARGKGKFVKRQNPITWYVINNAETQVRHWQLAPVQPGCLLF